jgi:formamidopyrimidine-DNA glycosylase
VIELPEAAAIARQMNDDLKGKTVESGNCGNSPHKWAFYSRPQEDYVGILAGKKIGKASASGSLVSARLEPGFALMLGDGGLRILLHGAEAKLPAKYQLMLQFEDGSRLTVSVRGWGFLHLVTAAEAADRFAGHGLSPLSEEFTYRRFKDLVQGYERAERDSIKYFLISAGLVSGIGNGYLQDILFRARLHPRRKVADISGRERQALFRAVRKTVGEAARLGGRDTEAGLHGEPGGYRPILDSRMKGEPCPECGVAIGKISYLGGSCYVCPSCQT